ncbi:DUF4864 domain-containing protein [Sagittula salina]|uniref:DUF4864 domain-containing protein n=1 Tax=Sagittula salina TaxID=2820268 RepID=A0A940MMZ2_9RHOB|nr:DUF4864 domain-containing protein [Sagittula salina]MBP0481636.1 DUF4864 domain-containing protein [Sagittula salina]
MRYCLVPILFVWGLMLRAEEVPHSSDREGVGADQTEAFLGGDFSAAFRRVGPGLQGTFGTPDSFGAMVRNRYPVV